MFFKNLAFFRLQPNTSLTAEALAEQLAHRAFVPCPPAEAESVGWVSPCEGGALVHAVGGQMLIALKAEDRLLPPRVIKRETDTRIHDIEAREARRVGRKERRELTEIITAELLPRAFVSDSLTHAWVDPVNGWLVVDTASPARADMLLEFIYKSLAGDLLSLSKVKPAGNPVSAMTGWVGSGQAPAGFSIDDQCEFVTPEKASVRYTRHSLDSDDVRQHVAQGKTVHKLAMTWDNQVSFVLNPNLFLSRVAMLDVVAEQAAESAGESADLAEVFDAEFALMTGVYARMLSAVLETLGGEVAESSEGGTPTSSL